MLIDDIRELTIINDDVTINGTSHIVTLAIDASIDAVQYHKGHQALEETIFGNLVIDISKYQSFIDQWSIAQAKNEADILANTPSALELAQQIATKLIEETIQNEINLYNKLNGIALGSVHNAESYSRVTTYTHKDFCGAVWLWSIELWEHMRAWQNTLLSIPTETDMVNKIAEKPFLFPQPI